MLGISRGSDSCNGPYGLIAGFGCQSPSAESLFSVWETAPDLALDATWQRIERKKVRYAQPNPDLLATMSRMHRYSHILTGSLSQHPLPAADRNFSKKISRSFRCPFGVTPADQWREKNSPRQSWMLTFGTSLPSRRNSLRKRPADRQTAQFLARIDESHAQRRRLEDRCVGSHLSRNG